LNTKLALFCVWAALVTVLSLLPVEVDNLSVLPHQDKLLHCLFYLGFSYLLGNLLHYRVGWVWKVLLPTIGYGILMECLQGVMGLGRYFDSFDIIANIIGALIGTFLIYKSVSR